MTPEQRRAWRRHVLGAPELTHAQRLVLLALETFADYADGTNAHPGETLLASVCDLQPRAVRYALGRGERLGLIAVTANAKRGSATVYRLVPVPMTGTAVPPIPALTGTLVPVKPELSGTAVPVNAPLTGTATHDDRHGDNRMTGTAVPLTYTGPFQYQGGPALAPGTDVADPSTDRPANGNAPAYVRGYYGPRCRRHAHLEHPPADCNRCQEIGEEVAP